MSLAENGVPFLGWAPGKTRGAELEKLLLSAVDRGFRHIATDYNSQDEEEIGAALANLFKSGKIRRNELFISAKLPFIGNDPHRVEHFARKSLKSLQLDYIDLYLVSSPVGFRYINDETVIPFAEDGTTVLLDLETDLTRVWKAMELLVDASLAKSIGVSHYNLVQLKQIVRHARIPPLATEVECHPFFQQSELLTFCNDFDIQVIALFPYGFGRHKQRSVIPHCGRSPLLEPLIKKLSFQYNSRPEDIILNFHASRGTSVVIAESSLWPSKELKIDSLSEESWAALSMLDKGSDGRIFWLDKIWKGSEAHPEYSFYYYLSSRDPFTADIVYPGQYSCS